MTIGASSLRKLKNAVPWRADTLVDFYEFTESLPAASVLQWTEAVEKWENACREMNRDSLLAVGTKGLTSVLSLYSFYTL